MQKPKICMSCDEPTSMCECTPDEKLQNRAERHGLRVTEKQYDVARPRIADIAEDSWLAGYRACQKDSTLK